MKKFNANMGKVLEGIGFIKEGNRYMWGYGSMSHGETVYVADCGHDTYEVSYHVWKYGCDWEPIIDEEIVDTCYGRAMLENVIALKSFRYI